MIRDAVRTDAGGEPLAPANNEHGLSGGPLLLRLLQFSEGLSKRPVNNALEYWRSFVSTFFAEGASFKYSICCEKDSRTFELSFNVLPRYFKIHFDNGLKDLTYQFNNAKETLGEMFLMLQSECKQTAIFEHSQVVTIARIRVVFTSELKIIDWEFDAYNHQELLARNLIQSLPVMVNSRMSTDSLNTEESMMESSATVQLPPSPVNEHGIIPAIMRCYEMSDVLLSLEDLMDVAGNTPLNSLKDAFLSRSGLAQQQMQQMQAQAYATNRNPLYQQHRQSPTTDDMSRIVESVHRIWKSPRTSVELPASNSSTPRSTPRTSIDLTSDGTGSP